MVGLHPQVVASPVNSPHDVFWQLHHVFGQFVLKFDKRNALTDSCHDEVNDGILGSRQVSFESLKYFVTYVPLSNV